MFLETFNYLIILIGFNLAAIKAGYNPDNIPISTQDVNEKDIPLADTIKGNFAK
jgi:hypothetical protein